MMSLVVNGVESRHCANMGLSLSNMSEATLGELQLVNPSAVAAQ